MLGITVVVNRYRFTLAEVMEGRSRPTERLFAFAPIPGMRKEGDGQLDRPVGQSAGFDDCVSFANACNNVI